MVGEIGLTYTVDAARSGTFFLPSKFRGRAVPLMMVFHGMAGNGREMVSLLRGWAEKYQFAVVGVDSRNRWRWQVADSIDLPTQDTIHSMACLDYVLNLPGVKIDRRRITTFGVSMGGYIAASLATHYPIFSTGIISHSRFLLNEIGPYNRPLWLSTGTQDPILFPKRGVYLMQSLRKARPRFPAVSFHTYRTGHCWTCRPEELNDLIHWWLNGGKMPSPPPPPKKRRPPPPHKKRRPPPPHKKKRPTPSHKKGLR